MSKLSEHVKEKHCRICSTERFGYSLNHNSEVTPEDGFICAEMKLDGLMHFDHYTQRRFIQTSLKVESITGEMSSFNFSFWH